MDGLTIFWIIIIILGALGGVAVMKGGGSRVKKATSMALNADLIKGGYKAYKKIKGNH
jgi:hypothetical protein